MRALRPCVDKTERRKTADLPEVQIRLVGHAEGRRSTTEKVETEAKNDEEIAPKAPTKERIKDGLFWPQKLQNNPSSRQLHVGRPVSSPPAQQVAEQRTHECPGEVGKSHRDSSNPVFGALRRVALAREMEQSPRVRAESLGNQRCVRWPPPASFPFQKKWDVAGGVIFCTITRS